MKIFLILLVTLVQLFPKHIEHISIDSQPFTIVKETYNEYGNKGEVMRFYKGGEKNETALLLTFTLRDRMGPCSARELEKGTYEINASTITFYSSWKRGGKAYEAPSGARVKVYKVLKDSTLKKVSSKVYIETSKRNYDEESGMQYLFTEPKTEEEKESLQEYIEEVEDDYDGIFVFAKEGKELIREVKKAFRRKTKALWGKRE